MSLRAKVWGYYIIFAAVVLIMLWFFQIVSLGDFYESMKIKDVKSTATKISEHYGDENFSSSLTKIAISNDLCIDIVDKYGRVMYTKDTLGKSCLIHSPKSSTTDFLERFKENGEPEMYYNEFNEFTNGDMLIYIRYRNM